MLLYEPLILYDFSSHPYGQMLDLSGIAFRFPMLKVSLCNLRQSSFVLPIRSGTKENGENQKEISDSSSKPFFLYGENILVSAFLLSADELVLYQTRLVKGWNWKYTHPLQFSLDTDSENLFPDFLFHYIKFTFLYLQRGRPGGGRDEPHMYVQNSEASEGREQRVELPKILSNLCTRPL